MKVLILCVDRDDDLGVKAGVQTPVVGRRRCLDAALSLGLADPEDSDTNAIFAAVRLYDKELQAGDASHQVEVAALGGHRLLGLTSDRKLVKELEEILELTRPDEVILVSDGAEDESIMPILTSRVKVSHVHRNIVKQAPRLEGFVYMLSRMLDDDKLSKRFILPISLVFLVWALAFLAGLVTYALAATLGIMGGWMLVHAMRWEDRVTRFGSDFVKGLRGGTIMSVANALMLLIIVIGGVSVYLAAPATGDTTLSVLLFIDEYLLYLISAFLVRLAGVLFDGFIRDGGAGVGTWTAAFTLIALGFIGSATLDVLLGLYQSDPWGSILTLEWWLLLLSGLSVALGGMVVARYVRNFFRDEPKQVR